MRNPDKYIRKAIFDTLGGDDGFSVNNQQIKVYDSATPSNDNFCVILSTQSGNENQRDKCSIDKERSIVIDCITRYKGFAGSREMVDDIVEYVLEQLEDIEISNFTILNDSISFPSDIMSKTSTESIFRKLINYSLTLKSL